MQLNGRKLLSTMALSSALSLAVVGSLIAAAPKQAAVIDAYTAPSQKRDLHFANMGIIKEVAVKEGQPIKKGQLLVAQDDVVDQYELERLKAEAQSPAKTEYYEAARDYKKKVYDRKAETNRDSLTKGGGLAFSVAETEEAQLDWVQAVKQIDVIKLEHDGDIIKYHQQQSKVDRMKLYSEFDGVVEKIGTWPGELAIPDKDRPAITIVQNDPCYVIITTLSTAQVAKLAKDDVLEVQYPGESQWRQAKVAIINPVARAESDKHFITLELPNPENRNTGMAIQVKLPAKLLTAGGVTAIPNR